MERGQNDLDSTCGISDEELTGRFVDAVHVKNGGRVRDNAPQAYFSMNGESLSKPEIIIFAGPAGSGKSTFARAAEVIKPYINVRDMQRTAPPGESNVIKKAHQRVQNCIDRHSSFSLEIEMCSESLLELLERAKAEGYFIRCIYVLTKNVMVNIKRLNRRGFNACEGEILSQYYSAIKQLPRLAGICDVMHIYDNTSVPFRLIKKRNTEYFYHGNEFWSIRELLALAEEKQIRK